MNWIKQNTKLAAILGVMLAGGIGLGVWLYMAWSDYSAQMEQWGGLDKSTAGLENSKIYPSEANMKALTEKITDYRDKFLLLQTALENQQQEAKPISETDFQAKLKERSRLAAAKAAKQATTLPKEFALSFEEYTTSLPTSPESAQELNVQLDVTEKLVNTILDAGVKSIDTLERTRLPSEKGGTPVVKPVAPAPSNKKKDKNAAPLVVVASVLDRYVIKCSFTCDSGPLQNVMNNLADPKKTPQFLAVRQLNVQNTKQEAPTKEEIKGLLTRTNQEASQEAPPPAPKTTAPNAPRLVPVVKKAAPDAAMIMGGEDLKVYMEVDYIRFRKLEGDAPSGSVSKK